MAQAKKKKKFFDVDMPLLKKQTQLYSYKIEDLQDRIIKYDLTRILKGKSSLINLKVQIDKENSEASSYPIEFRILPQFMKRMMRKRTDYVEDSFKAECKDATIILKPFLITRRRVHKKVRNALREKTQEELKKDVESKTSRQIFEEVLKNKLQRDLGQKLKKVYPLSLCEIRVIKVDSFKEPSSETAEEKQKTEAKTVKKESKEEKQDKDSETKTAKKSSKKTSTNQDKKDNSEAKIVKKDSEKEKSEKKSE